MILERKVEASTKARMSRKSSEDACPHDGGAQPVERENPKGDAADQHGDDDERDGKEEGRPRDDTPPKRGQRRGAYLFGAVLHEAGEEPDQPQANQQQGDQVPHQVERAFEQPLGEGERTGSGFFRHRLNAPDARSHAGGQGQVARAGVFRLRLRFLPVGQSSSRVRRGGRQRANPAGRPSGPVRFHPARLR